MKPTYYFPEHYKIHCLTDINSTINIHYSFIRSLDYVKIGVGMFLVGSLKSNCLTALLLHTPIRGWKLGLALEAPCHRMPTLLIL